MQLLSEAKTGREASPAHCAQAMLEGLPPVMWFIRTHMRKHRAHGLSVPQFRTLALLDRFPTASLSMVAENLGASAPTASRMVDGLVRKGLITRESCSDDRRQISLLLTEEGRRVLETSRSETQRMIADEVSHLPESERETIVRAMQMLHDIFSSKPAPGEETQTRTKI